MPQIINLISICFKVSWIVMRKFFLSKCHLAYSQCRGKLLPFVFRGIKMLFLVTKKARWDFRKGNVTKSIRKMRFCSLKFFCTKIIISEIFHKYFFKSKNRFCVFFLPKSKTDHESKESTFRGNSSDQI